MANRLIVLFGVACLSIASASGGAEFPLSDGKISVVYGIPGKQSLKLSGKWQGSLAGTSPILAGATLRVAGAYGEGGTAVVSLAAGAWRALPGDRGYKYVDSAGAAGGVRSVVLLTWLGFDDVRNYDGSWTEWGAGGYPVETGA